MLASPASVHFDVFSSHPYRWRHFPTPETWLPEHLRALRKLLSDAGRESTELWLTEIGIPVRGNRDPKGFFGYPESKRSVPGASRDYAARYLIKYHAIALQHGVKRVYAYNYQNRANDIHSAEDHFGLRSYAAASKPGYPLPAYVAWVTMTLQLHGLRFLAFRQAKPKLWLFDFGDAKKRCVLAWAEPSTKLALSWSEFFGDKVTRPLPSIVDLYGTPQRAKPSGIELGGDPIFVTTGR